MSELVHTGRGGEFATARRGGIACDVDFILAQKARGIPAAAIARMVGRPIIDVRTVYEASERFTLARSEPAAVVPEVEPPSPRPRTPASTARAERRNARRRELPALMAPRRGAEKRARQMPTWAKQVVKPIMDYYGVRLDELTGDSLKSRISQIRLECYWTLHQTGRCTKSQIGFWFGGRDHSSVSYGIGKHEQRLAAQALAEAA